MVKQKKCSGCKKTLPIAEFYKNKRILDGHSNYCVACTKVNSKKYFQKKKEKLAKEENDSIMKHIILNDLKDQVNPTNATIMVRIFMIENLCKSMLDEISDLKKNYLNQELSETP